MVCGATVPVVPAALLERAVALLRDEESPSRTVVLRARTAISDALAAIDDPRSPEALCSWDGSTDGVWLGRHTFAWACPWCSTEHETEVDGT